MVKNINYFNAIFLLVSLFLLTPKNTQAITSPNSISCKVHSYLVDSTYNLPYKYDTLEIAYGSGGVKPGNFIVYTFEINNQTSIERIELQKVYMTQLMGDKEPIEIIDTKTQNGNCIINKDGKTVFCNTNYSFAESAHFPIEFLVKIGDNPNKYPKTSSMFSIETTGGSAQCASFLWIKEENKQNPINWSTPYAAIKSDNFYIRIGDKKFYGLEPVKISSDPGSNKTTLESIWNENGVEMRMFMYFQKTVSGGWEMYELRSYNGKENGDWIYYKDSLGNNVSSVPGYHNYHDKRVFVPTDGTDAEIYCDKCSINSFFNNSPTPSVLGYSLEFLIGLPSGKIITITDQPMTGYGVNVLLKDNLGEVVKNQLDFSYEWSVDNPEVIYLNVGNIDYGNGKCAYDINLPCPLNHVDISGLKPGKTNIKLNIKRNSDGAIIAQNSFPIIVNGAVQTPTLLKCVNRGESVNSKTGGCCSGLSLIKPEGDRTDIMGVCMQECVQNNDCFSGEICQKQTTNSKFICSISNTNDNTINQLKNEVDQLKLEVSNQKIEQNKLIQIIESIKQYFQKFFGQI